MPYWPAPSKTSREGQQLRSEMASRMRQVLDDQRLVSLDTLLALGDGLNQMAKGNAAADSLLPLAGELREFEMPKPLFTTRERTELAAGLYSNRHTALQMRTDLTKVIKGPGTPAELAEARGLLTPFLRDTLVGLNYAYYEPPGAQMLHNNPLFVRSHDFSGGDYSGEVATAGEQTWRSPRLFGRGWTASGGAHLIGSLADLPYVLAKVEQDFHRTAKCAVADLGGFGAGPHDQCGSAALVGSDRETNFTPSPFISAPERNCLPLPRRMKNCARRSLDILSDRMLPQRSEQIELALRSGHVRTKRLPTLHRRRLSTWRPNSAARYPGQKGQLGSRREGTGRLSSPAIPRKPVGNDCRQILACLTPRWRRTTHASC